MKPAECDLHPHCLHLLQDMQACNIRPDGLYLPPLIHIQTHCMTQNYKLCPTYTQYCSACKPADDTPVGNYAGRRKYMRIHKKYPVFIQTCDSIGTVTGDYSEHTLTLDYSQGGMRVLLNREIPSDSLLRFDFGNDFVAPQLQGIAKMRWYQRIKDMPQGIEAGLTFQDHFSQAVLAVQNIH